MSEDLRWFLLGHLRSFACLPARKSGPTVQLYKASHDHCQLIRPYVFWKLMSSTIWWQRQRKSYWWTNSADAANDSSDIFRKNAFIIIIYQETTIEANPGGLWVLLLLQLYTFLFHSFKHILSCSGGTVGGVVELVVRTQGAPTENITTESAPACPILYLPCPTSLHMGSSLPYIKGILIFWRVMRCGIILALNLKKCVQKVEVWHINLIKILKNSKQYIFWWWRVKTLSPNSWFQGSRRKLLCNFFSFLFRPFQLNYLNRAPGGSYYATSYCASTNLFGSCTSYENQYFGGGGGGIGQKRFKSICWVLFRTLKTALLPRSGWKPLQHNVLQRPGLWRWRWTIKNQTKSKTSPQAKRHQPSLLWLL